MTINAGSRRFGPDSIWPEPVAEQPDRSGRKKSMLKEPKLAEEEVIEEEVDLNGFQVVRREFFAHLREPSIVFSDGKVSVNTACVRRLPEVEYIQILINRETRQLAIRPCGELDLFAVRWAVERKGKRFPRAVTGRIFFLKVCDMMDWNPGYRYKVLGRLCRAKEETLFVFDLQSSETYERSITKEDGKRKSSRIPIFPAEWKDQFGVPFEDQHKALQINMFDGFTLFALKEPGKDGRGEKGKLEEVAGKEE